VNHTKIKGIIIVVCAVIMSEKGLSITQELLFVIILMKNIVVIAVVRKITALVVKQIYAGKMGRIYLIYRSNKKKGSVCF
jgi:hypothetical protein